MIRISAPDFGLVFAFDRYCKYMFGVLPPDDLVGIAEIRFVESFSHEKASQEAFGCYLQGKTGKNAMIELCIPNLLKNHINEYTFNGHPEIAALLLSRVIFHEVGHHAHTFRRHGVKKTRWEEFADAYMTAGYFHYIKSRKAKIMRSYTIGALNFLMVDKEGRARCRESRKGILEWLEVHKAGVAFP